MNNQSTTQQRARNSLQFLLLPLFKELSSEENNVSMSDTATTTNQLLVNNSASSSSSSSVQQTSIIVLTDDDKKEQFTTKLDPTQYNTWTKEEVYSLLLTKNVKGGAGLSSEDVKPLYDAGFKGTSLDNIVQYLLEFPSLSRREISVVIDETKKNFADISRDVLTRVVYWADDLLKTRLYHLWSAEHAKQQLCKPIAKGGAGLSEEECSELEQEMKVNSVHPVIDEYTKKQTTNIGEKIKKWIDSIQLLMEPTNRLLSILDSLILTPNITPETYSYCSFEIPFVKRSDAFKDYCSYVDDVFAGKDPKESSASTIVFIGECPGVGKSRFAKELSSELKKKYAAEKPFTIIDLAIWFSNGSSPTSEELKDLNRLTIARIIYSYITYVRPHQFPEGRKEAQEIFKLVEGCDLSDPKVVFKWIARREFQLTRTNIWIHFTIDEYNQIFKHLKTQEVQDWCDYLSRISNIRNDTTFFTILLSGTHRETLLNLRQSKDSGGPTYMKRIKVTNFSQQECEEIYSHLKLPNTILLRCVLASFGGHARLIAMFSNFYAQSQEKKKITNVLTLLDSRINSSQTDGNIQLEDNPKLAEFLLMLCFTRLPVNSNLVFEGKSLSKYQRSNIVFLKTINGTDDVVVEIPLIIAFKMAKQVCANEGPNHFFNKFGVGWDTWLSFGNHFDTFENLNQVLLYVKLCSFQKLYSMGIIHHELINLRLLFNDETLKHYQISLKNVQYSIETLNYWYPSLEKKPNIEMNTVIKNGAHAPFADLFIILPIIDSRITDDSPAKKLFCYLQVKHTINNETLTASEIMSEFEKLEKKKSHISKHLNDEMYILFLTNRRTGDITTIPSSKKFSVIDNTNALDYYGPFAYLITTCPIGGQSLKTLSKEDILFWTLNENKGKAQRVQSDSDDLVNALVNNYSSTQLKLLNKLDLQEKNEINQAILLLEEQEKQEKQAKLSLEQEQTKLSLEQEVNADEKN